MRPLTNFYGGEITVLKSVRKAACLTLRWTKPICEKVCCFIADKHNRWVMII